MMLIYLKRDMDIDKISLRLERKKKKKLEKTI